MRRRSLCAFLLAGLLAGPAHAFIERLYSLKEVMDESNQIYVGRLTRVDATKRIAAAQIERALKGRKDFELVKMNLGIGPADHAAYLLGVLKEGDPVIIYAKRDGRDIASCVHAGDTWFQLFATAEPKPDDTWWRMTHVEIAMGRTFNGTTPDLIQITSDAVAGRAAPPKPNPSIPRIDVRRAAKPVQAPPPPASEPLDGLEAVPGWACEQTWARPATLTVEETRDRGKVLRARSDGAADKKLAITLLHHLDVSAQPLFAALVDNDSDRPIAVAVAFGCAPEWTMFEAPPVSVPAKARAAPVRFSVASPHFKCEASQWQHNQPIPNNGRVDKIMLLVDGLPAKGSVAFDRILGARGGFRLAGEFPHGGGEVRGISWADADGDDRLDALLCVGGANLLLLNQGGAFREQAAAFGLSAPARAAAWADYDGDGDFDLYVVNYCPGNDDDGLPDLLVTNVGGPNRLYHNDGDGTFRDVAADAGVAPSVWSTGLCWGDYDRDGDVDLYVCSYVDYDTRGLAESELLIERGRQGRGRRRHPAPVSLVGRGRQLPQRPCIGADLRSWRGVAGRPAAGHLGRWEHHHALERPRGQRGGELAGGRRGLQTGSHRETATAAVGQADSVPPGRARIPTASAWPPRQSLGVRPVRTLIQIQIPEPCQRPGTFSAAASPASCSQYWATGTKATFSITWQEIQPAVNVLKADSGSPSDASASCIGG